MLFICGENKRTLNEAILWLPLASTLITDLFEPQTYTSQCIYPKQSHSLALSLTRIICFQILVVFCSFRLYTLAY